MNLIVPLKSNETYSFVEKMDLKIRNKIYSSLSIKGILSGSRFHNCDHRPANPNAPIHSPFSHLTALFLLS